MNETTFKVVFSGKVQEHFDLVTVKQRLAALYKAPSKQIENLFSGKRLVLKSGLSREDAEKFRRIFDHTGAHCEVIPENLNTSPTPVPPTRAEAPPPAPISFEMTKPSQRVHAPYRKPKNPAKKRRVHPMIWALLVIGVLGALYAVMFSFSVRGMHRVAEGSTASSGVPTYSGRMVSYNDPSGFYEIEIPPGFSVENSTAGRRSRITFNYGDGVSLTIYARSEPQSWNPDNELRKRNIEIRQGNAGILSHAAILQTSPIQLAEAAGFQLNLRKGDLLMRLIELVNGDNTVFSMTIVTPEAQAGDLLELLTQAVLEGLTMR